MYLLTRQLGQLFLGIFTFGGAIYASQSMKYVGEDKIEEQKRNFRSSAQALVKSGGYLGSLEMSGSTGSERQKLQLSSSSSASAAQAYDWARIGGKNIASRFVWNLENHSSVLTFIQP
jgi:hypothetical protein